MDKVSIVGSGWLGLPLAKLLQESSYDVLASFRNTTTRFNLHQENINAIKIDLSTSEIPDTVFNRDILCILIPPSKNDNYVAVIKKISDNPRVKFLKQVIFISSTSVYEDSPTPKDELSPIKEDSIVVQAEKLFEDLPNVCILRFAGLMGENRYLAKYYKDIVQNSQILVNHIHKEDAIGIIEKIISENILGTYNVCAPLHPTRRQVIEEQCRVLNIKEPQFIENDAQKARIITAKIDKKIFYMYKYPNPIYFPLVQNQDAF
jgi:nucleoside-diphosphate-sugar epimerase